MRDGIRLATEVYRPPVARAPAIAVRTPYGRRTLEPAFLALARAGYAVVAQHCRGTGDSEPEQWDFYTYEREDSADSRDPTPAVGGSVLSNVYPPGSVDVTELQLRSDVLTFTSEPLERDLDFVGPLTVVLYASSTAEAEGGPELHGSAYPSHLIAYVI